MPVINQYIANKEDAQNTIVDTSYYNFQKYFGTQKDSFFTIEKTYDNTSFRLTKKMLQLIDYCNTSDTQITLKFYSPIYRYNYVGEIDTIVSNKLYQKKSNFITCNKQFYSVKIPAKSTLHSYLLYQPISFKDYHENKNGLYRYTNSFFLPEFNLNTNKENIGFAILMLLLLGMIFVLFIFYGLAFLNLKDKIYLSYSLYLAVTFFQVLYMFQYNFSKTMFMFNYIGNSGFDEITKGLMIVFYSYFYQGAFNITKKDKVLFYCISALKIISILYISIILFSYTFQNNWYFEPDIYFMYRFPIFFFSLLILVISIRLKTLTYFQKIILLGSFVYTFFTAFSTIQKIDYPVVDLLIPINTLYLGVALELIIFSIALGIRIKDSYEATEKLKDNLIIKLQESEEFIKNENALLETKVKERVAEIKQQNILIEEQKRNALVQAYEKEKLEIQQLALSSQMNPHFIFNCMNSIQHLIVTGNTEKASQVLHNFASLIRMVLENSTQPDITLENEILLIETYLKLEQERTNHGFDFEIKIDNSIAIDFIKIPNMMLQPFLENALLHGFKFITYKGKIDIHFSIVEQLICCEIIDNGIGRTKAMENKMRYRLTENKSIAINLIQDRIELLNQTYKEQKAALVIEDLLDKNNEINGTKVIVYLPII